MRNIEKRNTQRRGRREQMEIMFGVDNRAILLLTSKIVEKCAAKGSRLTYRHPDKQLVLAAARDLEHRGLTTLVVNDVLEVMRTC